MEDGAMVALKATPLFCIDGSCLVTRYMTEYGIVIGNCRQPGDQNGGLLDVKPRAKAIYNIWLEHRTTLLRRIPSSTVPGSAIAIHILHLFHSKVRYLGHGQTAQT